MLVSARNLSGDPSLIAAVQGLGACSSMYGHSDIGNASFLRLRPERSVMQNVSALAEREVSSTEVDVSRWVLTRGVDSGNLVVALVDLIQATTLIPALKVLAPGFVYGTGLEAA